MIFWEGGGGGVRARRDAPRIVYLVTYSVWGRGLGVGEDHSVGKRPTLK